MTDYDVIIIGAGSVGVPSALALAKNGIKILVLDSLMSVGQGQNKAVIGGLRATHTQRAKIWMCQRSIEIFSSWKEEYGDDIGWLKNGYCYVAYTPEHEKLFKNNIVIQKSYGLNIDYHGPEKIKELIPGINENGLLGGTFSPDDGNASPLLFTNACYCQAMKFGAEFHFNEKIIDIFTENGKVSGVQTNKSKYSAKFVINAAGSHAKEVAKLVNIVVPVNPTSHEAGISEPVKSFIKPMVVDIRPGEDIKFGDSKNYYFYQNNEGQIVFCLTPNPPIYGFDNKETSVYLPQIAKRMILLLPRLKNLKIRRTWRGLYPDTPDGAPIVGKVKNLEGYINAVGMCGQGFMLGPGLGELIYRLVINSLTPEDKIILEELSLYRDFGHVEMLK
ncbi:MAG: NAD(P)/FAD-dependent oxidoreductase [Promethearchaeota archaeon]